MTARAALSLLAALLCGPTLAVSQESDPALDQAAERRFRSAERFYAGGRHAQALRDFEVILDSMAGASVADDAALRIARHRFEVEGDAAAAEAMVDRLLREFPAGDAVPGAHLLRGEMALAASPPRPSDARAEFERVLTTAGPGGSRWSFAALGGIAGVAESRMEDEAAAGALLAALHESPPPPDPADRFEARLRLARALARADGTGAFAEIAALRADLLDRISDPATDPAAADGARDLAERAEDLSTLLSRFQARGGPVWQLRGAVRPPRELDEPIRVRFAGDRIHVLDRDEDELQTFTAQGTLEAAYGLDDPRDAAMLRVGDAVVPVVVADDQVAVGGNILPLSAPATGRGRPLDRMRAVAAAPEGLWVWDDREKAVFAFDLAGRALGQIPHGPLDEVRRIVRHPAGSLVVVDGEQGVVAFDEQGTRVFQLQIGPALDDPADVAFDDLGHLYVLDRETPRLSIFDAAFGPVATLEGAAWPSAAREPVSLDVGPDGGLFVLDDATRSVVVLQ